MWNDHLSERKYIHNTSSTGTVHTSAKEWDPIVHWPIANHSRKFHANPFRTFCAKLLTDKQTNNDENITSLAEVIRIRFIADFKTRL